MACGLVWWERVAWRLRVGELLQPYSLLRPSRLSCTFTSIVSLGPHFWNTKRRQCIGMGAHRVSLRLPACRISSAMFETRDARVQKEAGCRLTLAHWRVSEPKDRKATRQSTTASSHEQKLILTHIECW